MSDFHENGFSGQSSVERVGDIIHRERLTRNIQIETIAHDLKLNADYIRGIEESNYGKLPAVAYGRVYIKSIAKYLGLNGDMLLELFSREMNIDVSDPERERRDTISVKVQGTKKTNAFLPLLYLTIALILIALLLKNGNRDAAENVDGGSDAESLTVLIPADTGELADDSLPGGVSSVVNPGGDSTKVPLPVGESVIAADSVVKLVKKDSLITGKAVKKDSLSTVKPAQKQTEITPKADKVVKKKLTFELDGKEDSSYVTIYADGKKVFDGIVSRSHKLSFKATDSLNCMIGKNKSVTYRLNGTPLNIEGTGPKIVKLTGDTIELWRMNRWKSVFQGR